MKAWELAREMVWTEDIGGGNEELGPAKWPNINNNYVVIIIRLTYCLQDLPCLIFR